MEPRQNTPPLCCFDFDGTFIDQSQPERVDPALAETLGSMRRMGATFAINTGRPLYQAVAGINGCALRDIPDYLIAWEREIYRPTKFRRWVDLGDWNSRCRKDHRKLFRSRKRTLRAIRNFVVEHSGARWVEEPHEPAGIIARDDAEMDHLCGFIDGEIAAARDEKLSYERNSIYLRFAHSGYNKGSAAAELGRQLGVPPARTFAIGDNHNDLSMLDTAVAAMVACPGNAVDRVKQAVSERGGYVAEAHAGEGVAEALNHFFGAA